MKYETIAEVYEANDRIQEKLKSIVGNLTEEQADFLPVDGKWTVAQIVEHLSKVEDGMTKIFAKLLKQAQAEGKTSDGTVKLSGAFLEGIAKIAEQKLEALEIVHPEGKQTIAESLAAMKKNRQKLEELRPLFETVEGTGFTFPHPAFGEINAHDWLALIGGHTFRHIRQIEKILAQQ
ncbi:MAG: DinB family protein [Acidobacteriota bacterium]|nr:DinB family protein [Acidobacteriota bacterium]